MSKAGSPQGRKRLQEMTPQELRGYFSTRRAELADFSTYVQRYLNRRKAGGKQTHTDERYNQFQKLAADLIAALDELSEAAEEAGRGETSV